MATMFVTSASFATVSGSIFSPPHVAGLLYSTTGRPCALGDPAVVVDHLGLARLDEVRRDDRHAVDPFALGHLGEADASRVVSAPVPAYTGSALVHVRDGRGDDLLLLGRVEGVALAGRAEHEDAVDARWRSGGRSPGRAAGNRPPRPASSG